MSDAPITVVHLSDLHFGGYADLAQIEALDEDSVETLIRHGFRNNGMRVRFDPIQVHAATNEQHSRDIV